MINPLKMPVGDTNSPSNDIQDKPIPVSKGFWDINNPGQNDHNWKYNCV